VIQALNGAGDTRTPSVLNVLASWVLQIPLACWLAFAGGLGPDGVFIAIVVSESVLTIMSVLVLRRGTWHSQVV
jgi:Na+-driven multidrug efflux pump